MSETTNKKMNGKKIAILVTILALLIAGTVFAYVKFSPKATQGAKAITIEVTDDDEKTTSYEVHTDAEFLRQAIEELQENNKDFSFSGSEGDYGLMIDTVNGVKADFNVDGAYWAIYVNGEFGNYGIDDQPVTDGDSYGFTYTKGE